MDEIRIAGHLIEPTAVTETFDTSGGPGGQHSNRNETSVRLRLDVATSGLPSDLITRIEEATGPTVEVVAADSRSQFRNRALARQRLIEKVEQALIVPTPRKPTRPTKASKNRRVESKKARGETKRLRRRPDIAD